MEHSFDGRVAVITGAGGVLCSVMAKALAEAGARVALLGRTAEKVQRVADEITAVGGTARAYVCDVCDRDSVEDCHRRVLEQLGQCDLLIKQAAGHHGA
jgi:NADP-dependent 3-hydroxy acid dehydrogenase YdfG